MKGSTFAVRIAQVSAVALLAAGSALTASDSPPPAPSLSADASDPRVMGWMQGFPPPPEQRITQPDTNFFSFPKLRWSVCHMRELLPTTRVATDPKLLRELDYAPREDLQQLQYQPLGSDETLGWQDFLDANYTDGLAIMHRGKLVHVSYSGCLRPDGMHAAMSMTKSFTGLLAEMLVAEGAIDAAQPVAEVIPELATSAFGDATVRQVMDMTTALQYSENYADPNADIWVYSRAASPLPKPADYDGPNGYFEYLQTVQKNGEHGDAFGYRTVNSDALGWIIARSTGTPVNELLAERIWQPMGSAYDAYMTVDGLGTPFAGGGLSANLLDLARFGQLLLDDGVYQSEQVIPASAIASIRAGGDREAFAKAGYSSLPGGSYRSMWWVFHNEHGAYAARGVHGQTIYIDPTAQMVIVRFASHPVAGNAANDPTSLPAYAAIAKILEQP
ncbi:serine hydrolase domain-containing protein [Pseudidiomarina salilacus]|uniref:serine hydrolase domain-containing protein n=1 Tax=Pseudidiomarina salilacus TaxID=3384452 RepID=UPI003984B8B1